MSGAWFSEAQIGGVVEADFFDWIVEVPGGDRFVKSLARRLTRFAWENAEPDVMKELYESIISPETRHRLGEYYAPSWLAEKIVAECVIDPLTQCVLDASCGSGTFLFHAVRRYLAAAEAAGPSSSDAIPGVVTNVVGIDVHPVAVALTRVTY
jgi:type I restriction-modification system DNA methylase subunit